MLESMETCTAYGDHVFPFLYPLNRSLAEEVERLFSKWTFSHEAPYCGIMAEPLIPSEQIFIGIKNETGRIIVNRLKVFKHDVMREFRLNGQDSEYCPEFMPMDRSSHMPTFLESNRTINLAAGCTSTATTIRSKKRTKKQMQECVFCKNNGEQESYYKRHILKDSEGRVVCPILRAYTCPICNAKGDDAHTIKYCPLNNNPEAVAAMNALKAHRTSTGHRRNKSTSSA